MKNPSVFPKVLLLTLLFSFSYFPVKAQLKSEIILSNEWAGKSLVIDGQLDDWSDSLKYFHERTGFSYNVQNDKETLYLAIKSHEKENLSRIIARGISFSVNTEGKKKQGQTLIFPLFERASPAKKPVKSAQSADQQSVRQAELLSRITKLFVTGFTDIKDGPISLQNDYGILAAASFDKQGLLVIEVAIPFEQLQISNKQNALALLVEINGIKQPKSSYNPNMNRNSRNSRYGYPNRDYGYDRLPAVDKQNLASGFWLKSILATKP